MTIAAKVPDWRVPVDRTQLNLDELNPKGRGAGGLLAGGRQWHTPVCGLLNVRVFRSGLTAWRLIVTARDGSGNSGQFLLHARPSGE
jgi:hypothetical protein